MDCYWIWILNRKISAYRLTLLPGCRSRYYFFGSAILLQASFNTAMFSLNGGGIFIIPAINFQSSSELEFPCLALSFLFFINSKMPCHNHFLLLLSKFDFCKFMHHWISRERIDKHVYILIEKQFYKGTEKHISPQYDILLWDYLA